METFHTERWVFTHAELHAILNSYDFVPKQQDEFVVPVSVSSDVIVYRNGLASNRYECGTVGLSDEDREMAEAEETYYTPTELEEASFWRDVIVCDEDNTFVCLRLTRKVNNDEDVPTKVQLAP